MMKNGRKKKDKLEITSLTKLDIVANRKGITGVKLKHSVCGTEYDIYYFSVVNIDDLCVTSVHPVTNSR